MDQALIQIKSQKSLHSLFGNKLSPEYVHKNKIKVVAGMCDSYIILDALPPLFQCWALTPILARSVYIYAMPFIFMNLISGLTQR